MKILITGDMGTIGEELKGIVGGNELMLIDKKRGFHQDLAITNDLPSVLGSFQPEVVFHLAASFERTQETPEAFEHIWHNDTLASHRLIEALIPLPSVKKVVFASSYLIYKLGCKDQIEPRNLCGMSKLYTERELDFVAAKLRPDWQVINARIFRVYGRGSKSFINRWAECKKLGWPTQIFNEENRYDFIHARDVAEALARLADSPAKGVVNVGTGVSMSVADVSKIIGVTPDKIQDDTTSEASCADISLLHSLTNWKPTITLEQGIEDIQAESSNNVSRP